MSFSTSVPCTYNPEPAIVYAGRKCVHQGLHILTQTESLLVAETPAMNVKTRLLLTLAGRLRLEAKDDELHLDADFSGIDRVARGINKGSMLLRFMFLMIMGLLAGLIIGWRTGVGFGAPFAPGWKWIKFVQPLCSLPLLPWVFLTPLLRHFWAMQTKIALHQFLKDCALKAAEESRIADPRESPEGSNEHAVQSR